MAMVQFLLEDGVPPPSDDDDLADAELWAAIDSAAARSSLRTPPPASHPPKIKPPFVTIPPSPQPNVQIQLRQQPHKPSHLGKADQWQVSKLARREEPGKENMGSKWKDGSDRLGFYEHNSRLNSDGKHKQAQNRRPVLEEVQQRGTIGSYDGVVNVGQAPWMTAMPSVSVFKQFQEAAMAVLEKGDYVMMQGKPFIKKSGWRKIAFFFNISFEIKDRDIQFDSNANVLRAEFVVRASMQSGRYSDGWGSCDLREKRFSKPNHDVPSTAETRAKTRACQDLLGIGEYKIGCDQNW